MASTRTSRDSRALTAVSTVLGILADGAPAVRLEAALSSLAADGGGAALYRLDGDRFRAVAGSPSAEELEPEGTRARKLLRGRASGDFLPLRAEGRIAGALELRGVPPLSRRELEVVTRAFALAVRRRDPRGRGTRADRPLIRAGALATVGALTPKLAHELNNHLFGMLGLVEFLLDEAEPGSKGRERLELVQASGLELKGAIRELLGFANDRTPRRELRLGEVVREMVELVRLSGASRTTDVVEHYRSDATVLARPVEAKLAVLALLLNAVQAVPDGGTVEVEVRAGATSVSLTVTDDGPGLDEESSERAFELFFSTSSGAGLGLPAARAVARSLGGDVTMLRVSRGAGFRLTVPRRDSQ